MTLGFLFIALLVALVVGVGVAAFKRARADRSAGIRRFGVCALQGDELRVGRTTYQVTPRTSAEVVGSVSQGRRSTATRTLAGGVVAGPVAALVGHSAKKKTASSSALLSIDGADWAETIPVPAEDYASAVRFAQAINLAARTASR